MRKSILILQIIFSNLCFAQDYCNFNKNNFKISCEDITLYGIIHATDIDALNVIPGKYIGELLCYGSGASLQLIRIKRTDYIKMELSYVQKGFIYKFSNQSMEDLRLNYFEIPLLWSHHFYLIKYRNKIYFETGLAFSKMFFSSRQISLYVEQSQKTNTPNLKNIDIPIIAAIKVPTNVIGKKKLLLGLRFSYSPFSTHNGFKTSRIQYFSWGIQIEYLLNH